MDWQQIAALGLVAATLTVFAVARYRRRNLSGCPGGCCGASKRPAWLERTTPAPSGAPAPTSAEK